MIVDIHYHHSRFPTDEKTARRVANMISFDFSRLGVDKPQEEVISIYRDYMDDVDGDKLIKRMDDAGIDVTVLLNLDNITQGQSDEDVLRNHEECARKVTNHPRRFIALAGIDPRRANAPDLLRQCIKEYDMKGLKWHPDYGYYPNSEEAYEVLKIANEYNIPLLTHCSPLSWTRSKYAHPIHLDDIAFDFPTMNIIAAHCGLMWWHEWAALAQVKSNISGDLAMWQFIAESRPALFRRHLREIIDIIGPEQVLFATDGPYSESHVTTKRWVQIIKDLNDEDSFGVSFNQEEIDAILGGNAARIFKLQEDR